MRRTSPGCTPTLAPRSARGWPRGFGLPPLRSPTPTTRADGTCSREPLPPIAQRVADEVWMRRFISCFGNLARRFERREVDATRITTCTAEEMALHLRDRRGRGDDARWH